jgi:large-conductance mechanosensitive channel
MNCKKCGSNIASNMTFCPYCGEKVENNVVEESNNIFNNNETEQIETLLDNSQSSEPITTVNNNVNQNVEMVNQTVEQSVNNTPTPSVQIQTEENPFNNVQNSNVNIPVKEKKKSNVPFIILLVIMILIIIGLAVFIFISLYKNNTTTEASSTETVEKETEEKSTTEVSTTNKLIIDNYEFTIPNGYKTSEQDSYWKILNSSSTALLFIDGIINQSYDVYVSNAETIKLSYTNAGYVVNGYTTKTVGNVNYLIYDVDYSNQNMYDIYAKLDDTHILMGSIMISPSTTYDNALEEFNTIISSAKGGNNTSGSATFSAEIPSVNTNDTFIKKLK